MTRKSYILKRFIQFPILLILTLSVIFLIIKIAPGDPVKFFTGESAYITEEYIAEIRRKFALDRPLYEQFFIYLDKMLHGDFGYSFKSNALVLQLISDRLFNTLMLTVSGFLISVVLGSVLGITASKKAYSLRDNVISFSSVIIFSMPQFWISIIILVTFSVIYPLFPAGTLISIGKTGIDYVLDYLWHLALPAFVLGISNLALFVRLTRASMLEQLGKDYILTARSKGCTERTVLYKHAFRNALLPIVTMMGLQIPWLMYGAVLVETIFSWPGLGLLIYTSIFSRDYNIIMAIFVFVTILVMLTNLIVDIIYSYLDPRIVY